MWNFCDDSGIHPASAKRLKMEVLPGEDCSIDQVKAYVNELVAGGLIEEFTAEGRKFWIVTGWHHQKIEKPTYRYPLPPDGTADNGHCRSGSDGDKHNSTNGRRVVGDNSSTERSGAEGSGMDLAQAQALCAGAARDLDSEEVLNECQEIAPIIKPVPGRNQDREDVIKAVIISKSHIKGLDHAWLWNAVETVRKRRKVKTPMALFRSRLAAELPFEGNCDEKKRMLNRLMAAMDLPPAYSARPP